MGTMAADPFDYTATGRLGEKRETMLHNQLLLRDELARPMKRGYIEYPGTGYCYGRPNAVKDGGAAEALSGWPGGPGGLFFHRKKENGQDSQPDRDFMALNRSAVQAGLTTSAQQSQYRASHDIRRKVQTEGDKKKSTRRIPPTMVFGIATRPSTPIHDLLEHKYQDRWLIENRSGDSAGKQRAECRRQTPGKVNETRASQLRVHQVPVASGPLWQLPKFSNRALPHLETFRTDKARSAAFDYHKSDAIGRQGIFGHGIHEPAKN